MATRTGRTNAPGTSRSSAASVSSQWRSRHSRIASGGTSVGRLPTRTFREGSRVEGSAAAAAAAAARSSGSPNPGAAPRQPPPPLNGFTAAGGGEASAAGSRATSPSFSASPAAAPARPHPGFGGVGNAGASEGRASSSPTFQPPPRPSLACGRVERCTRSYRRRPIAPSRAGAGAGAGAGATTGGTRARGPTCTSETATRGPKYVSQIVAGGGSRNDAECRHFTLSSTAYPRTPRTSRTAIPAGYPARTSRSRARTSRDPDHRPRAPARRPSPPRPRRRRRCSRPPPS